MADERNTPTGGRAQSRPERVTRSRVARGRATLQNTGSISETPESSGHVLPTRGAGGNDNEVEADDGNMTLGRPRARRRVEARHSTAPAAERHDDGARLTSQDTAVSGPRRDSSGQEQRPQRAATPPPRPRRRRPRPTDEAENLLPGRRRQSSPVVGLSQTVSAPQLQHLARQARDEQGQLARHESPQLALDEPSSSVISTTQPPYSEPSTVQNVGEKPALPDSISEPETSHFDPPLRDAPSRRTEPLSSTAPTREDSARVSELVGRGENRRRRRRRLGDDDPHGHRRGTLERSQSFRAADRDTPFEGVAAAPGGGDVSFYTAHEEVVTQGKSSDEADTSGSAVAEHGHGQSQLSAEAIEIAVDTESRSKRRRSKSVESDKGARGSGPGKGRESELGPSIPTGPDPSQQGSSPTRQKSSRDEGSPSQDLSMRKERSERCVHRKCQTPRGGSEAWIRGGSVVRLRVVVHSVTPPFVVILVA